MIVATGTFQKRYMHSPFANFTLLQLTYKHNGICCGLFSAAFEFEWILILVRCNLDLGILDLVTTFDLVGTFAHSSI